MIQGRIVKLIHFLISKRVMILKPFSVGCGLFFGITGQSNFAKVIYSKYFALHYVKKFCQLIKKSILR